jgi:hypothetical protein
VTPPPEPQDQVADAQKAAIELARWQGEMDERMKSGDKRFGQVQESIARIESSQGDMKVELATVKTKVALYGALGGMAGSVIVGLVIVIGTKALG